MISTSSSPAVRWTPTTSTLEPRLPPVQPRRTEKGAASSLYLVLLDEDGADLGRNHGDDGADVAFESVRVAAPSGHAVPVHLGHMLSHAFHLFTTSSRK